MKDITIPINGARNIKAAIFRITAPCMALKPFAIIADPAKPPIKVCEEEDGMPCHHVNKFQIMAPIIPANIIGNVIYCSYTVFETVLAIPNSPIIYFEMKKATKLKKAAHITAWSGVSTFVVTIVEIEFAAS